MRYELTITLELVNVRTSSGRVQSTLPDDSFGVRLKAGHQFLVLIIEVRILYPELPPNPEARIHEARQRPTILLRL